MSANDEPHTKVPSQLKPDDGEYTPHLIFIRQLERLDEAMAEGRDPYPAYRAWQSALVAWAREDAIFMEEAKRIDGLLDEAKRRHGLIPRLEYVSTWRPVYIGVMRRMGLFDTTHKTQSRNYEDLGVD